MNEIHNVESLSEDASSYWLIGKERRKLQSCGSERQGCVDNEAANLLFGMNRSELLVARKELLELYVLIKKADAGKSPM
ncbi:hypothetical protein MO973_26115 [Paenibacillus sp. TRM 82003]|nr:hypothetical protein [Paenibacillus sp. TRM 82003]